MWTGNYLLFIDPTPVHEDLKHYFLKQDLQIIQQATLHPIPLTQELPAAILLHSALLKNAPEIMKEFYEDYPVPLLLINDRPDEEFCIVMLEAGADAYMTKPLDPHELHARIQAITRRLHPFPQKQQKTVFHFSNWILYPASRQIFHHNKQQELQLSAREYDLLLTFVQYPQQILSREFLLQKTQNSPMYPFDRRIDLQIGRLRQKIEVDAKHPDLIRTIRNEGYLFTAQVINSPEP